MKKKQIKTVDNYHRLSWDEYFMKLAWLIAERSTCLRHHVGAVIVKNNRILATGYNGAAINVQDCISLGCLRNMLNISSGQRQEICRAIHAEQNAIIQSGCTNVNIEKSTLYCTHSPCILCAKMIVNASIERVVMDIRYSDNAFEELFLQTGIAFSKLKINDLFISQLI
ncbi:MAG: dCMP deaminase family protein [Endomicrobium sp.]|jgi:dCMP deaminase|nr:dCMP deaminase family protein [Endomicrobium sp.]